MRYGRGPVSLRNCDSIRPIGCCWTEIDVLLTDVLLLDVALQAEMEGGWVGMRDRMG
jgi:hypothetical protein